LIIQFDIPIFGIAPQNQPFHMKVVSHIRTVLIVNSNKSDQKIYARFFRILTYLTVPSHINCTCHKSARAKENMKWIQGSDRKHVRTHMWLMITTCRYIPNRMKYSVRNVDVHISSELNRTTNRRKKKIILQIITNKIKSIKSNWGHAIISVERSSRRKAVFCCCCC
jgi:hypothetical protein